MLVKSDKDIRLGIDIQGDTAYFSLFSEHATAVILGLFEAEGALIQEVACVKNGAIWEASIKGSPRNGTYAFRVSGPSGPGFCFQSETWLADPYATSFQSPEVWGKSPDRNRSVRAPFSARNRAFDWQGVKAPQIPKKELVIYEMHVRGFTKHPSSQVAHPGTFQGIIEKIPYLKKLGVNALELMPIFEFDETYSRKKGESNYWGYNPLHFFAPMRRYSGGKNPIDSFKEMVRELHRNGMEVILDVVYNHTGEGKELDYLISFRGIDHPVYYMLDEAGNLRDFAGCGNVLNANHPIVQKLILDSLRYWIEEFHVDGFRFDLAAILTRDTNGEPMAHPPLMLALSADPLISKVKLIAEVWDAAGLYLADWFAITGHWSEWNGQYRDHVRRFIKGTDGEAGKFASCLCGSDFLFGPSQTPLSSINFITAHDGFTLRDLVSYNQKHNEANGEENRDGTDSNESWNCGTEGATDDPQILRLRERQMRNFFLALFLSQGIPMLSMRDEYGHSCQGNNNPYVQDNELNWFVWNERPEIVDFVASLITFRKSHPEFSHNRFLTEKDIAWHGWEPHKSNFGDTSRFVAFTLNGPPPLYVAFNADSNPAHIQLPEGPWRGVVMTEKRWGEQGFKDPQLLPSQLSMVPFSALLAIK